MLSTSKGMLSSIFLEIFGLQLWTLSGARSSIISCRCCFRLLCRVACSHLLELFWTGSCYWCQGCQKHFLEEFLGFAVQYQNQGLQEAQKVQVAVQLFVDLHQSMEADFGSPVAPVVELFMPQHLYAGAQPAVLPRSPLPPNHQQCPA